MIKSKHTEECQDNNSQTLVDPKKIKNKALVDPKKIMNKTLEDVNDVKNKPEVNDEKNKPGGTDNKSKSMESVDEIKYKHSGDTPDLDTIKSRTRL